MLILDEADEMLNKGFKEQIYDVYRYLPPSTQVCLISATLPHEILEMTSKFMSDPIRILVKRDELVNFFFFFENFVKFLNHKTNFLFLLYRHWKESNNFLLRLREKNGNLILFVTCTTL